MRILTLVAAAAISIGVVAPATAQQAMGNGTMTADSSPKMSDMQMKKMNKCKAMDHDMMMKDSGCVKMMKKHPDMMSNDTMAPSH